MLAFSARHDAPVPADAAFARLCDPAAFEAAVRSAGVQITRLPPQAPLAVGLRWQALAGYRGVTRQLQARVSVLDPGHRIVLLLESREASANLRLQVQAGPDDGCTLLLDLRITPRGLAGRLAVQPLRLAQARLQTRLAQGLARYADTVLGAPAP